VEALLPVEELTAVVAVNDTVALGFWEACRRSGVSIPRRLSLVGFDNDPETLAAGLTTIERPAAAVGEAAAAAALERIAAPASNTMTVRLRPVLIERSSVLPMGEGQHQPRRREPTDFNPASHSGREEENCSPCES
jgi:LacI family transcriptional regulator